MKREQMAVGGRYNWKGQSERLVYLGRNWSGNGYWHQFAKTDQPSAIWCEVLDSDLCGFEVTKGQPMSETSPPITASIKLDDGGDAPAYCVMVAYRNESDAQALLRTATEPKQPVPVQALVDLQLAAETLRKYEVLHRAKGTVDSTAKAEVNAELASQFEATLALYGIGNKGEPSE